MFKVQFYKQFRSVMSRTTPRLFGLESVKALIAAAPQQEFGQTKIRVGIVALVLAYLLMYVTLFDKFTAELEVIVVTSGFLAFSIVLMFLVLLTGRDSVPRRFIGMIGDNAVTTFFMTQMGEVGAVILFVYLWITFGNNFRYGRLYLHACQAMSIAGFSIVLALSPFWSQHLWI